jgi:indolepyruvate decarboxylase
LHSTYLIKKLHECGVEHIFGVPGDYVLGLYDQLIHTKTLEVINTCDEQAAAFDSSTGVQRNQLQT